MKVVLALIHIMIVISLSGTRANARALRPHEVEMRLIKQSLYDIQPKSNVLTKNVRKTKAAFREVFGDELLADVKSTTCPFCMKTLKNPSNASASNFIKHLRRTHMESDTISDESKLKMFGLIELLKQRQNK